ncbi:3-hydroxyanthranilic acid dioxygenase [Tieghemiomyces parasiticus]|uniref:3-hydroxyanthranilate 3,4-dioxygenase n=1 Tax=Tieghemiomyces parasiticus TaxID=78921 RepID=A0A9W8DQR3_9FUNG|nr:3-hydroxyanthranilic acid dioxygenase [Tieghemiomyces parasiticus]
MPLTAPINFPRWIEENRDRLQPPVCNAVLQKGDFLLMVVGGPNHRTDYHINETEEWFYQYKGDMVLKVVDEDKFVDIHIREGDMFLLPGNVPHSPVRVADTIGIVMERKRKSQEIDILRWYCEACHGIVFQQKFHCTDLGKDLKPIVERYATESDLRVCSHCGHQNSAKA